MALPTSNRAVVWVGHRQLAVEQRPVRAPGPGEVLVKLISTGICGSDCHNWESHSLSRSLILGHESSGVIELVGPGVTDRRVGDRVAVEPGFVCNDCEFCRRGRPNICANLQYCGLDPTDGTLCQYAVCKTAMAVPIPGNISWLEAGSIQPLAVAVQLAHRAELQAGQSMAIFGCGPLGLLILAVARAYGLANVFMFDIEESRTRFAETYGAAKGIVVPAKTDPAQDDLAFAQEYAADIVAAHQIGHGFDVAVEASGAAISVLMGISMLKAGGTMVQAGLGKPLTNVPLFVVTAKELAIKGTVRYTAGCFQEAIRLLSEQKIDLKPLITSTFPLTRAPEAFAAQNARQDIKIIIMNQE